MLAAALAGSSSRETTRSSSSLTSASSRTEPGISTSTTVSAWSMMVHLSLTHANCLEHHQALAYAKERQAFGQPISRFQTIQAKLASLSTEIEATRLLVYKAA